MLELLLLVLSCVVTSNWCLMLNFFVFSLLICVLNLNGFWYMMYDNNVMLFNSSNLLVCLSCFLCFLALISTPELKGSKFYSYCLVSLLFILILVFSSSSLLFFYIFFEMSLIPTLFLVVGWGYQPERLQAGSYMIMYTVGASLPLLIMVLFLCFKEYSHNIYLLHMNMDTLKGIMSLAVYGAFLVKLPMYGVHLWLPKAHVEAPLAGSMILAGILLKLGGFGMMEVNYCFNVELNMYCIMLVAMSMWGGFLSILSCLRQSDMKALVAYSSVVHMGVVIVGIMLDSSWGMFCALLMMVSHGFCSSCLFCLAYFSYEKSGTRNIPYMKGLLKVYPTLSMMWFLMVCVNMGCPPTLNLISEMCIIPIVYSFSLMLMLVMGLMILGSASYNMYLYSSLNHGMLSSYLKGGQNMKSYMFLVFIMHSLPLVLLVKLSIFCIIYSF